MTRRVKTSTRARLMASALRSFQRKGYHGTTLRAVASDAGLTTGAVYSQFPDKAALLVGIVTELEVLPNDADHRRARGLAGVVLALAAEAAVTPKARSALAALLQRHELHLAWASNDDRSRILLAAAAGELVLRVAGLTLPDDWTSRVH